VVAVNAADEPATLELPIGDSADGPVRLEPVALPGFGEVAASAAVGGTVTVALAPRSGGLFRIA